MKKIKTIKKISLALLSIALVPAVLLSATHAKDIVPQPVSKKVLGAATITQNHNRVDDPIVKAIGDLHSHTDKTMVKHIVKSVGDTQNQAIRRDSEEIADAHPISTRLLEMSISMRLLFAFGMNAVRLGT